MTADLNQSTSPVERWALEADEIRSITERFRLVGRRFVVLGGGRGMGRHAAHALAELGADVVIVDSDLDRAEEVAAAIPGAVARAVDATSDAGIAALAEEAGRIDGVVDVIGIARYASLLEVSEQDWNWEHDIVLRHAWLALRHFGRRLAAQGSGSFTFVASVSGISSSPGHGAYGAFKAGLVSLVRTAAVELGPQGVRVNAVAPGFVLTPRMVGALDEQQVARGRAAGPLPVLTTPSDIAAGITFLASDLASSVTGQTLVIDAGATVSYPYAMDGIDSSTDNA
ncbi:SDR family NAD(P)-dependent oxidoreductase [Tomitella fengzijianii]|uniref:SDR family oxidoreductase n=1 Tax=Tomitella fengzijianii TaxID=2597660 RepID=A0A516X6V7_9ACTN|nr:SDR family oxidoreductase [Tomitella fengzijianii]QDQ98795.1 SDR family oxidoreductase [Tomitella fengzijianii]